MTYPTRVIFKGIGSYPERTEVEFNRVNFLLGDSGAGKSLARDIMRLGIQGHCPRFTDGRGAVRRDVQLLAVGAEDGQIAVEFPDNWRIHRRYNKKLQMQVNIEVLVGDKWRVDTNTNSVTAVQREIFNRTAADRVWDVLFDAGGFAKLNPKDRQTVLQTIVGDEYDENEVAQEIQKLGPLVFKRWEKLVKNATDWQTEYKRFYELRRLANVRVKELKAVVTDDDGVEFEFDEAVLSAAKAKRDALQTELEQAAAAEAPRPDNSQVIQKLKDEQQSIRQGKKITDIDAEIEAAETLAKQAEVAQGKVPALPENQQATLRLWEDLEAKLAQGSPVCPLTRQPCEAITSDMVQTEVAEARRAQAEYDKVLARHRAAETAVTEARQTVQNLEREKLDRQKQLDRLDEIPVELERLQIPEAGSSTARSSEVVRPLLAEAQEKVGDLERQQGAADRVQTAKKEHAAVVAEAQELDALVRAYAPEGLPQKLAKPNTFKTALLQGVERFTGFKLDLDAGLVQMTGRGVSVPLDQLSVGEAQRVGVAAQLAVGYQTGLWFVVVDEWGGALGYADRQKILKMLKDVFQQQNGGCALLLGQIPSKVVEARLAMKKLAKHGKPPDWNLEQYKAQQELYRQEARLHQYKSPEFTSFEVEMHNLKQSTITKAQ